MKSQAKTKDISRAKNVFYWIVPLQDHKLVVQEVGSDRVVQEVAVGRPVLDVCPIRINGQNFVAVLAGADVVIYKWS